MGLILDSSVIIGAERRGHHIPEILQQICSTYGEVDVGLSVITIAELVHGAYRAQAEVDRLRRLEFIEELCRDVPVHPVTIEIARLIGRIEGQQAAHGISLPFEDPAIGATALELGFGIATLNVRHFQMVPGLNVVSPSDPSLR